MLNIERTKQQKLKPFLPAFFLLFTFGIYLSYATSYSIYVFLSFVIFGISLYFAVKNCCRISLGISVSLFFIISLSFVTAILHNGVKDAVMASSSLLLPFFLTGAELELKDWEKACFTGAGVTTALALLWGRSSMFLESNTNSMGFLMYLGFGFLVLLFCSERRSLLVLLCLALSSYFLYWADSRNVFFSFLFVVVLALFRKVLCKRWLLRLLYLSVLAYVVFYPTILSYALKDSSFMELFSKISTEYFNKNWGIANRYGIYVNVYTGIKSDLFVFLFGTGTQYPHTHNGYYQALYMYGIFGTVGIGALCVSVFEMAIKLITVKKDMFIFGVYAVLLGVFLQQAADVYLFGCKTCTVIVCFYMALITNRYYKIKGSGHL